MAVGLRYVSADPRGQTGPDLGLSTLSLSHNRTNPPQALGRFWNTTQRVGWVRAGEMPGRDTGMGLLSPASCPQPLPVSWSPWRAVWTPDDHEC